MKCLNDGVVYFIFVSLFYGFLFMFFVFEYILFFFYCFDYKFIKEVLYSMFKEELSEVEEEKLVFV